MDGKSWLDFNCGIRILTVVDCIGYLRFLVLLLSIYQIIKLYSLMNDILGTSFQRYFISRDIYKKYNLWYIWCWKLFIKWIIWFALKSEHTRWIHIFYYFYTYNILCLNVLGSLYYYIYNMLLNVLFKILSEHNYLRNTHIISNPQLQLNLTWDGN